MTVTLMVALYTINGSAQNAEMKSEQKTRLNIVVIVAQRWTKA
jgi:hypothetical protein